MNSPPIKCEAPCGNGATLKHRTTNELDTTASSAFVYFFLRALSAPIKLSRTTRGTAHRRHRCTKTEKGTLNNAHI
jgi:hypothetical protein